MAGTPFFRTNDRTDWIFVANAALALAGDDFAELERAFGSLGPGVVSHRPRGILKPDVYLYLSTDLVVILVQGTEGVAQWIGQLLGSAQSSSFTFPGKTSIFDNIAASSIISDIDSVVRPALATAKLACIGHSLGGALAQMLGSYYLTPAVNGLSVMTIGCPRVGNPDFAAAIGPQVQRLIATNDPIGSIPPTSWQGVGSAFPLSGPGPQDTYQHAGPAWTLAVDGTITEGETEVPTSEIVSQLTSASTPTHAASWYLAALLAQSALDRLQPGDFGYADPNALWMSTQAQLNLPPFQFFPGVFSMASDLIQGTLFFRDRNISEGWSEQIYTIGDIPGSQTLLANQLSPRSIFLANDMEIHAYRSAVVGDTKNSQTTKLQLPQRGQYNDGVNEAKDCILYLLKTAVASHRLMTFRGIPDGAIASDNLTDVGRALTPSIDSYVSGLIAAGLVLKVKSAIAFPPIQIQAMANLTPGSPIGVTTVAAHGYEDGDIINLAGIRGYPYLLGRWLIQVTGATTFVLTGSERYNISSGRVGTVQAVVYAGQTVTKYGYDSVGTRATGRPFGQPRGKRPKKVLHR